MFLLATCDTCGGVYVCSKVRASSSKAKSTHSRALWQAHERPSIPPKAQWVPSLIYSYVLFTSTSIQATRQQTRLRVGGCTASCPLCQSTHPTLVSYIKVLVNFVLRCSKIKKFSLHIIYTQATLIKLNAIITVILWFTLLYVIMELHHVTYRRNLASEPTSTQISVFLPLEALHLRLDLCIFWNTKTHNHSLIYLIS